MASSRQSTQSLPLYSGWSRIQPMSFAATSLAGSCIMHGSTRLAFRQKFDVSKDLLLARFGSSLAVRQEFGRGNLCGHGRECRRRQARRNEAGRSLTISQAIFVALAQDRKSWPGLSWPSQFHWGCKQRGCPVKPEHDEVPLKTTAPATWSRYCCGTCRDRSRPARQAATARRKRACRRSWRRSPWRSGRAARRR